METLKVRNDFLYSKIAAFSILIPFTISLFVTPQNIEAQLNATQSQNATQPLGPDEFTCTLSPDQPSDPVEMKSVLIGRPGSGESPSSIIRYIEKESFDCASPISTIPPPYKADLRIIIDLGIYSDCIQQQIGGVH